MRQVVCIFLLAFLALHAFAVQPGSDSYGYAVTTTLTQTDGSNFFETGGQALEPSPSSSNESPDDDQTALVTNNPIVIPYFSSKSDQTLHRSLPSAFSEVPLRPPSNFY